MYESPSSLQEACLSYISENIEALCEEQTDQESGVTSLVFHSTDVVFPAALADQLLRTLCSKQLLTDHVLSLFRPECMNLRQVWLNGSPVTAPSLRILKEHRIVDINAVGLKNVTINELISCLGDWTLNHLRNMNVMSNAFTNSSKCCVVVALSKLRNLQCLNVSNTAFNTQGLSIVAQDLKQLDCLDISNTSVTDLSPLQRMHSHLKSLSMYNLRISHMDNFASILCELTRLQHLDISDDISATTFTMLQPVRFCVQDFLEQSSRLQELMSLDISGRTGLTEKHLRIFLSNHRVLQFLGLSLTEACEYPLIVETEDPDYRPQLKTTGDSTKEQLMEALRRYTNRTVYVQRTLYHLFRMTQTMQTDPEPTAQLIKLILPAMKAHPRELGVQMAATACLYNLSRGDGSNRVHPHWLSRIVTLTMDAMENFPNHKQLQKNALLTLCSDRILQVNFDRYRCAHLVMECLCAFEEATMDRMCVAVCGILVAKIPTNQTARLGTEVMYMQKLLSIVQQKTAEKTVDITLKFTLSALWNLTDESPSTCEVFIARGGLELFADVLSTFEDLQDDARVHVETKVLGLVNNLAEVKHLQLKLLNHPIMNHIRQLLYAEPIDVSYFAAGIISHLVTSEDGPGVSDLRNSLLQELGEVVLKWEQPEGEMVAYRSFSPFLPLLMRSDMPQVQLWAVWAIHHVCTKSEERYCSMLVEEGGASCLWRLTQDPNVTSSVLDLASRVVNMVDRRIGTAWKTGTVD